MGGVTRLFKSVISTPKAPIAPVAQVVAQTAPATQVTDKMAQKKAAMGSGYGTSEQTILASGTDTEANVQKTVLGQGKKKKIKA